MWEYIEKGVGLVFGFYIGTLALQKFWAFIRFLRDASKKGY
jgi:hypothetical protein